MFGFFRRRGKRSSANPVSPVDSGETAPVRLETHDNGEWSGMAATARMKTGGGARSLGESLVDEGYITRSQLEQALILQRRNRGFLGMTLLDLGHIGEKELIDFLVRNAGDSYTRLVDRETGEEFAQLLPRSFCAQLKLVPVDKAGRYLTVAMLNPNDNRAIAQVYLACPNVMVETAHCERPLFEALLDWFCPGDRVMKIAQQPPAPF